MRLLAWVLKKTLALRYKIRIKEQDLAFDQGVIFIPNHPAEIDPIIVMSHLWSRFKPRPLVVEHYYYLSGAKRFMNMVRALPVPNFETSTNAWKVKNAHKTFQRIKEGLARGQNFLIYPSGHLKRDGHEPVGGSLVHQLLQECPNAKIVLVRTTGLWGSSFSRGITGVAPRFWKAFRKGIFTILKNGIFFVPKRHVKMEVCCAPDDFPREGSRKELNHYLENWFNRYPDKDGKIIDKEPLVQVSYSRFSHDVPEITAKPKESFSPENVKIDPKIRRDVIAHVAEVAKVDAKNLDENTHLVKDLGLDSLDIGTLSAYLDHKYHVATLSPQDLQTIKDLCVAASGASQKASALQLPAYTIKRHWPDQGERPNLKPARKSTIPAAFLDTCTRMKNFASIADGMTGPLSYKDLKRAVVILAEKIRKMPGKHIGIMIPSSVAVNLVILATQLTGKIPVMLNWTSGVRTLDFAQDLLKLKTVISSRRFLDRLDVLELGTLEDKLCLLEDLKGKITLWDKIKGALKASRSNELILDDYDIRSMSGDDTAVILFTSGTETLPKAVPLTHKNILLNHAAGLAALDMLGSDIMYGVLPPFHSFGFSITGLMPIIFGMRAIYSPDPTDGSMMARDIAHWHPTMMCCAPSFYKNLFRVAEKEQLLSIRLFVTGAEKAPPELFRLVKELGPDKQLIEGYGITECAPAVTFHRSADAKGVGQPLPGVEIRIIHPETQEPIPSSEPGEICIRGPNVFNGYLGPNAKDPFIEIDGLRYYRSGDIGYLDKDENLIIEGRLKRFVKIGGEMISLTAVEQVLAQKVQEQESEVHDDVPTLAIGTREGTKGPELILYTTLELAKEDANQMLKSSGFGRIVKIHEVKKLSEIPLTGTGKIHYRALDEA